MDNPLDAAAAEVTLADPVPTEEPREGEPGGEPCGFCAMPESDAVWANTHWRLISRSWSPNPGGMLLLSRAHVDTLSEMAAERQQEFGIIAAAIERAIMGLGGVARVHLYRWGDGRAHFHAHFVPRPYGRPQLSWRNLPFLEQLLPDPGEEQLAAAAGAVGAALAAAGIPS
jgi:diadenosine tetraphosphate (Ap4A) HIT family hydrolase